MPTNYSVCIRPEDTHIRWPAATFSKDDEVRIETYTRGFVQTKTQWTDSMWFETILGTPEHLLAVLEHPQTQWDALCSAGCTVELQLSYWILFDTRDTSLDGEPADGVPFSVESDYRRNLPLTTLDSSQISRLRSLLLKCTNLVVEFTDTGVHDYGPYLRACYVGVIRSFPNITDLDYSWCDKYGWPVKQHIWDCYEQWKVKTARCITLHGSDDNCSIGTYSEEHNYIELGDGDLCDPELEIYCWDDVLRYMSDFWRLGVKRMCLWHLRLKAGMGTPDIRSMQLCPNLRDVRMSGHIELSEKDCILHENTGEQYWVVDIPPMPNMVSFDLELHTWHTDCSQPILLFRFGAAPKLQDISISLAHKPGAWGVIVREGYPREFIQAT